MWIDTHCHLDAGEFGDLAGQLAVANAASAAGVECLVIPAVHRRLFGAVEQLAAALPGVHFALGIHPMYVPTSAPEDLDYLQQRIGELMADPLLGKKLLAVGEIGLDYFVPALCSSPLREKQEYFYQQQLKIARQFDLPVLLHVRRSQDQILKQLRRLPVGGGIAHAFNGSRQQAEHFLALGLKLGFGGAMTFSRALQIRRLAAELPEAALVLETDAPDMPPSWLSSPNGETGEPAERQPNTPSELPRIGACLAELRGWSLQQTAAVCRANSQAALPRLQLSG